MRASRLLPPAHAVPARRARRRAPAAVIVQSLHRWMRTAQAVVRQGLLHNSIDTGMLARQLMINFIGVLDLWIHQELDDDGFRAQSLYGFTLLVLANAPKKLAAPGRAG